MKSGLKWTMAMSLLALMALQPYASAQSVLQRGYDSNVSGATVSETTLGTSNLAVDTFGLVFNLPVDATIYAQPLYVSNVAIPGRGNHNVLYVATMNDSIYAFDADVGGAPLWSVNLASFLSTTPVVWANFNFAPIKRPGNLGILSTPVIDPLTNVMYAVACTLENNTMAYRLYAIDIADGSQPYGPGVLIAGRYGGVTFDARYLTQRMSLALSRDQVIIGFGALQSETSQTYSGWVMAYSKLTLQQSGVFATVTAQTGGGAWQSGRPPAVDNAGHAYVFSGNAKSSGYDGVNNFSESVLKLDPAQGLALLDWFTSGNWSFLDQHDLDLTSSGPILIPGTTLLAGGGKTGDLYVLDTANLGHWNASDSQVVQKENITGGREIDGGPVYWGGSTATGGPMIYNWGAGDTLKAYPFNGRTFATSPSAQSTLTALPPGGLLVLSANGNVQGSSVLWANLAANPGASPPVPPSLHAFNAENVGNELWNSTMNAARDGYGSYVRLVPPLVANGKVYVPTSSGHVAVYGLLTFTVSPISLLFGSVILNNSSAPQSVTVTNIGSAPLAISSITFSNGNAGQFSQTNTCGASVPVASTCTIRVVFKPTSAGSKTVTLKVLGAAGSGTQAVILTGTGVAPPYTVSPASLDFGSVPKNTASVPQSVTVTNVSGGALPITSIGISGKNPGQFSQTNTCGTSIPAGSTCAINVVFAPTSTGSKEAVLNVNAGNGSGTQTVALAGTAF